MFVDAIEEIKKFTRPVHTIMRHYSNDFVQPGAATLFFVNEDTLVKSKDAVFLCYGHFNSSSCGIGGKSGSAMC